MKKLCLLGILSSLLLAKGFCQDAVKSESVSEIGKGFYVRFHAGYSFGAGKMGGGIADLDMPGYNYTQSSRYDNVEEDEESYEEKRKAISLGQGVDLMLGAGYMFNRYVGIDFSISSVFGSPVKVRHLETSTHHVDMSDNSIMPTESWSSSKDETVYKLGYTGLFLTPAVRLVAPVSDRFSLYSRIGVAIPLLSRARYTIERDESSSRRGWFEDYYGNRESLNESSHDDATTSYRLNSFFRLGFDAALGLDVTFGRHWSLYAEVEARVQSFAVKKKTMVEYVNDGRNLLPNVDEEDRVVEYVRKREDTGSDDQRLSYNIPASSIGINIGFVYRF